MTDGAIMTFPLIATPRCQALAPADKDRMFSLDDYRKAGLPDGLVIVTDIAPFATPPDDQERLRRLADLNAAMLGAVWSFEDEMNVVPYPRKEEVRFPARSVAAVAFHSTLLRRRPVRQAVGHSAALTMFTLLSLDVVFPLIGQAPSRINDIGPLHAVYGEALAQLAEMGMEIHGFNTASAPPYQDLWLQMKAGK